MEKECTNSANQQFYINFASYQNCEICESCRRNPVEIFE